MTSLYTYLIASLPILEFGGKLPFTSKEFLERNHQLLSETDIALFQEIFTNNIFDLRGKQEIMLSLKEFEVGLRNELVKIRSARKKIEVTKYFRGENLFDNSFYHIAMSAQHAPNPLEGELILDRARWNFLEELKFGHYFDLSYLLIYSLELMILERWDKINSGDAAELLEGVFKY
jgi:hypothetical protein